MTVDSSLLFAAYEAGNLLNHRYRKVSDIQSGTFGTVSLAVDTRTSQKVAIKAMDKTIPQVHEVAAHEISILTKLQGVDNVCQLQDHFESDTHFFLVLEHCEHGDLYDFLHQDDSIPKPYENSEIFKNFAMDLGRAIRQCHDLGVFHRDIKPENILVTHDLKFKLADWGLACTSRFSNEAEVGTDKYMAPECVFRDTTNTTYYDCLYADYWSFGITLLYTLFGSSPFSKCSADIDALFKQYLNNADRTNASVLVKSKDVNMGLFYDIYPNLSTSGFDCLVKPLLQLAPQERSLDQCLELMELNYRYGFTVDEELEMVYNNNNELPQSKLFENEDELLIANESDLFDSEEDLFIGNDNACSSSEFDSDSVFASPLEISSENLKKLNNDHKSSRSKKSSRNLDMSGFSSSRYPSIPPSLIDSTSSASIMKLNSAGPINIKVQNFGDSASKDKNDSAGKDSIYSNSFFCGSDFPSGMSWGDLDDFEDFEVIDSFKNLGIQDSKPFDKVKNNQSIINASSKLSASLRANKNDNWC